MIAPKLRFSEFRDEWQSEKLGEVIDISSASRVFKEQWQESGVPFFRTSDVVSIFKNTTNEKAFISNELYEELAKKSGKIQKDDLLITGGGSIGIPYLVKDNKPLYFKDADLLWLKSSGKINGSYLYNFFVSPKFREYLKSISHTGTISHFTIEQAKTTPIVLPSMLEQTKIAEFLSAVDDKISQLSRQLELLNQYKKGVMQKIFSQEIRFKNDNGEDFGEWKYLKLNEIAIKKSSKISANQIQDDRGDFTIFGASGYLKSISFFTEEEDYIAVVKDGAGAGRLFLMPKNSSVLSTMDIIRNNSLVNLDYLFYRLNKIDFNSYVKGSTIPHVYFKDYSEETIEVPTIQEQEKIAEFLTAIDERIDHTTAQLTHTKQWKKGLLQQMFV